MSDDLGRVTIVRSRYGGIYEPGIWIAFACWPAELPTDWNADDASCAGFFAERGQEIGGGDTPKRHTTTFSDDWLDDEHDSARPNASRQQPAGKGDSRQKRTLIQPARNGGHCERA